MSRAVLDKKALRIAQNPERLVLAPGREMIVYDRTDDGEVGDEALGYTTEFGDEPVEYPITADERGRFPAYFPLGAHYWLYNPATDEYEEWDTPGGGDGDGAVAITVPVADGPYVVAGGFSAFNTTYQNATLKPVYVSLGAGVTSQVAAGAHGGRVWLETCPNNSFGGGDTHVIGLVGEHQGAANPQIGIGKDTNGIIPVGWYYRWRTETVTGTPIFTFQVGLEVRLALAQSTISGSYVTATATAWETATENTSDDPIELIFPVTIACDPGEHGKVILDVCPDDDFGSNSREVAVERLKVNGTVGAAVTMDGCLKGIVPAGYFYRYRRVSSVGAPTFTARTGNQTTLALTGVVPTANYSSAGVAIGTSRQNTSDQAVIVQVPSGIASDAGENGHNYTQVSKDGTFADDEFAYVPYMALRNSASQAGALEHGSTLRVIVPAGWWWKDTTSTTGGWNAPAHSLDGNETVLEIPGVTTLSEVQEGAQPVDDDLTEISALATTPFGRTLLTRSSLGADVPSVGNLHPPAPPFNNFAAAARVANRIEIVAVRAPGPSTVTGIQYVSGIATGNVCRSAIYDSTGALVARRTTNDTAAGAAFSVHQVPFDAPVAINPGLYFIAIMWTGTPSLLANSFFGSAVQAGSGSMPGSITPPSLSSYASATTVLITTY